MAQHQKLGGTHWWDDRSVWRCDIRDEHLLKFTIAGSVKTTGEPQTYAGGIYVTCDGCNQLRKTDQSINGFKTWVHATETQWRALDKFRKPGQKPVRPLFFPYPPTEPEAPCAKTSFGPGSQAIPVLREKRKSADYESEEAPPLEQEQFPGFISTKRLCEEAARSSGCATSSEDRSPAVVWGILSGLAGRVRRLEHQLDRLNSSGPSYNVTFTCGGHHAIPQSPRPAPAAAPDCSGPTFGSGDESDTPEEE